MAKARSPSSWSRRPAACASEEGGLADFDIVSRFREKTSYLPGNDASRERYSEGKKLSRSIRPWFLDKLFRLGKTGKGLGEMIFQYETCT